MSVASTRSIRSSPPDFRLASRTVAIDDRQEHHAVDEDVILVPVVGEFLEHHAILLHALDEFVGTGANRMQAELVAFGFRGLGRDHHAGAVGELRDQRRERRLQYQLDGQGIDHLDMIERRQLRLAERSLHRQMPLERELGRLRIERLAVVEFHAGAQLDRHSLPSAEVSWDSASCGTMLSFSSMSNSLSQNAANTMRPT